MRGPEQHRLDDVEQVADHADRIERVIQVQTPWLTAQQAIRYLQLGSRSALTYALRQRKLPFHRLGRDLRFYAPELDAWLLETGSGPALTKRM